MQYPSRPQWLNIATSPQPRYSLRAASICRLTREALGNFEPRCGWPTSHRDMPKVLLVFQDDGKGGLGLRGVAFMTLLAVSTVLAVLESALSSSCLSYKIQCQDTTVTVLTGLVVSAVVAVSVVTATPSLNSILLFRHPEF